MTSRLLESLFAAISLLVQLFFDMFASLRGRAVDETVSECMREGKYNLPLGTGLQFNLDKP